MEGTARPEWFPEWFAAGLARAAVANARNDTKDESSMFLVRRGDIVVDSLTMQRTSFLMMNKPGQQRRSRGAARTPSRELNIYSATQFLLTPR